MGFERAIIYTERITRWLDAQHQYTVIAQRAGQQLAPHVAVAMGLIDHIHIRLHLTRRLGAAAVAGAAGAASADQAAVASRAGREQIRLSCTHPPRCGRLLQSVKTSRSERPYPSFGTPSSDTLGTTGKGRPKS